jgi:tetratricopeptide (TPR) repeat protein
MVLKWILKRWAPSGDAGSPLETAQALRRNDEFDAAREVCLGILRDEPDDADAMALMAAMAADQWQFENGMQWARRALAARRDCVPAHFAMGRLFEGEQRYGEAEACYRQVVRLDPGHASGHTNLGCMLHVQGRIADAIACYRQALKLEPGQPEALRNFALVAGGPEELRAALEGFEFYLATHPRDARAHHQLAHLQLHLGRHEQALAAYERAIALEPDTAEFHLARAQLLLLLGRYAEGWREYEWRWRMPQFNGPMVRFTQPRWDGQPLQGTLLVHSEPGFGDVFQLVRYATLAAERCARVVVECKPALADLVAGVAGVAQVVREGDPLPPFDAHIPPIAFPHAFGTTLETIPWRGPYIVPDPARVREWTQSVAASCPRERKVGLVWTGNPGNFGNRERSVTLQQLGSLAQAGNASFFSLQKGEGAQPGPVPAGMHFVDLTGGIRDFSDTAALLAQLDLVISIDTSVAHLAGAMGRPVWVLLPFSADWRYHVARRDNPWYPSMQLFRQESEGDWSAPLQRLTDAFTAWAAAGPG